MEMLPLSKLKSGLFFFFFFNDSTKAEKIFMTFHLIIGYLVLEVLEKLFPIHSTIKPLFLLT